MFTNRKERGELLEGLVISNKEVDIPNFSQVIISYHICMGENQPNNIQKVTKSRYIFKLFENFVDHYLIFLSWFL